MTETVNHTPGPWRVFNGTDIFPDDDDKQGTRQIADCAVASIQFINDDEARANARLIAAAPELLAALWAYMSARTYDQEEAAWRISRAAIAKATGATA